MSTAPWHYIALTGSWAVCCAWFLRVSAATRHMPGIPDLSAMRWNRTPATMPSLTVIVPARNEAADIAATLDSLVAQDYLWLQIVAVNDRSTDETGAILDWYAAKYPARVRALHITDLPLGWLGKTHAMHVAFEESASDYVLFTDADIRFVPSILRRSLAYMEQERAAHLVVAPTAVLHAHSEGILLGAFQMFGMWAVRPWKVADPAARIDSIGVGAFNLLRRDALLAIGGLEPQRLAIIEDGVLGMRIKGRGMPQRLVLAPGMVTLHWATGAHGMIRLMTKNLFSGMNFHASILVAACVGILLLFLSPLAGITARSTLLPSVLTLCFIAMGYRAMRRMTSIPAWYAWFYPLGVVAFVWAMLRSMLVTLARGGVEWRSTFYPLRELRKHNAPWQWRR